ncbi:MAG: hypothetical protein VX438_04860, partial [Planctomycetota bacterium]|nr:hypothetical protein [Planctomycetota bacterium]
MKTLSLYLLIPTVGLIIGCKATRDPATKNNRDKKPLPISSPGSTDLSSDSHSTEKKLAEGPRPKLKDTIGARSETGEDMALLKDSLDAINRGEMPLETVAEPHTPPEIPEKRDNTPTWTSRPNQPQNALIEKKIRTVLGQEKELTVAELEKIQDLTFVFQLNDEGLKELAQLKRLRRLLLVKPRFTDDGLHYLARLPDLQSLVISGAKITDLGLQPIAKIKSLRNLELLAMPITDQGLAEL